MDFLYCLTCFQRVVCISSRVYLLTTHAKKGLKKKVTQGPPCSVWVCWCPIANSRQSCSNPECKDAITIHINFISFITFPLPQTMHCTATLAFRRTEQNTLLPSDYHDYEVNLILKLTVQRLKFVVPLASVGEW